MTPLEYDSQGSPIEKPDASAIRRFMASLPERLGWAPSDNRYSWPNHVYRFDDVIGATGILQSGQLLCRARAQSSGVLRHDAANPEIIQQSPHAHRFARLYFGPRTPMQYAVEGIRPIRAIGQNGAHCPVPVFLIFDGPALLSLKGVQFSDGNFATSRSHVGDSAEFLERMPWDLIYHRGSMPVDMKEAIKLHRMAEVLIASELNLQLLRGIVCRSGPERTTLLTLLGADASRWEPLIRVERPDEGMFERGYYYIEDIQLSGPELTIRSRHTVIGPYRIDVTIRDIGSGAEVFSRGKTLPEIPKLLRVSGLRTSGRVSVKILIDNCLAYHGDVFDQRVYGESTLFTPI